MKKIVISSILLFFLLIFTFFMFFVIDHNQKKKNLNNQINLISKLYDDHEYDSAKDILNIVLVNNADNKDLQKLYEKILMAERNNKPNNDEVLEKLDRYQKSIVHFMNMMNENKKANLSESQILEKMKRIYMSDEKIEMKSRNPEADIFISDGIDAFKKKDYALALTKFGFALKIDKENPYANAYSGACLYEQNPNYDKNIEEASIRCNNAIKNDQSIEVAHFTLGRIYVQKKMTDEAIKELNETIKINPNNYTANYELGKLYFLNNDFEKARSGFNNAIEVKSDFAGCYYYLSEIEIKENNYTKAKEDLNRLIEYDPGFASAYINLAIISRNENRPREAINFYTKANSIEKNYKTLYEIGECYKLINDDDKAIDFYTNSVNLNPSANEMEKSICKKTYLSMIEIYKRKGSEKKLESLQKIIEKRYPEILIENN
jgi:tetratricopeptide (TPR) repeat protein